jgi:hypothetical protein
VDDAEVADFEKKVEVGAAHASIVVRPTANSRSEDCNNILKFKLK